MLNNSSDQNSNKDVENSAQRGLSGQSPVNKSSRMDSKKKLWLKIIAIALPIVIIVAGLTFGYFWQRKTDNSTSTTDNSAQQNQQDSWEEQQQKVEDEMRQRADEYHKKVDQQVAEINSPDDLNKLDKEDRSRFAVLAAAKAYYENKPAQADSLADYVFANGPESRVLSVANLCQEYYQEKKTNDSRLKFCQQKAKQALSKLEFDD